MLKLLQRDKPAFKRNAASGESRPAARDRDWDPLAVRFGENLREFQLILGNKMALGGSGKSGCVLKPLQLDLQNHRHNQGPTLGLFVQEAL